MSELKDKVIELIRSNKGSKTLAVKNSLKWYSTALSQKDNKEVVEVPITEKFKAGKMYRFTYYATTERLPYFDTNPIVLSLGQIKHKNTVAERGLNFNYLPHDIRVYLIDRIERSFHSVILHESKRYVKDAQKQRGLPISYSAMRKIIEDVGGEYAIRNYTPENKSSVGAIAYEQWDRAALIETDFFKDISQGKVHRKYIQYIKNKKKRKK